MARLHFMSDINQRRELSRLVAMLLPDDVFVAFWMMKRGWRHFLWSFGQACRGSFPGETDETWIIRCLPICLKGVRKVERIPFLILAGVQGRTHEPISSPVPLFLRRLAKGRACDLLISCIDFVRF